MKPFQTIICLVLSAMAASACISCHPVAFGNILDPDTLTVDQAKKYVKNYERHAGMVDPAPGNEPLQAKVHNTRCVWFSLEKMKALAQQIKTEGGDGVRFYISTYDSVYEQDSASHIPQRDYWGHNTLIMVSTKDTVVPDGTHYHWDYYGNTVEGKRIGRIILTAPENKGELCPPPTPCTGVGATLITTP